MILLIRDFGWYDVIATSKKTKRCTGEVVQIAGVLDGRKKRAKRGNIGEALEWNGCQR